MCGLTVAGVSSLIAGKRTVCRFAVAPHKLNAAFVDQSAVRYTHPALRWQGALPGPPKCPHDAQRDDEQVSGLSYHSSILVESFLSCDLLCALGNRTTSQQFFDNSAAFCGANLQALAQGQPLKGVVRNISTAVA